MPGTPGFPVRLTKATLTLNGVFTNTEAAVEYRWTTLFTTHSTFPASPIRQTVVRLPPRLTLTQKLVQPHGPHRRLPR